MSLCLRVAGAIAGAGLVLLGTVAPAADPLPAILTDWWRVAGNPNVDPYTTSNQQPVDFAIWQDADDVWHIWSCIRRTSYPGNTRLLHGWESPDLFAENWTPTGIEWTSQPALGEVRGGMQAPYVFREGETFHMMYGSWNHLARATSSDGAEFTRVIQNDGTTNLFGDGETNPRDITVIRHDDTWYGYYTEHSNSTGGVYLRTSTDLDNWSERTLVSFGGSAGSDSFSSECPFVYYDEATASYYLFRTQDYGVNAKTSVYRSQDPTYFGVGDDADDYLVGRLPVAAPEIFDYDGKTYIAALTPGLDGIQIAEFGFVTPPEASPLFALGGLWEVTSRRAITAAPGGFAIDSITDALMLLSLPNNDRRVATTLITQESVLNFNHTTGNIGRFGDDEPFPLGDADQVAIRATGKFQLLESGPITFGLTANDGARLMVDGQIVLLDNSANPVHDTFGTIELEAGLHTLELVFFQHAHSAVLELYVANEVGTFTEFVGAGAPSSFWHLIEAAPLAGDYDHDGDVDQDDYTTWRDSYGQTGNLAADGNFDGVVDARDYVVWRNALEAGEGAIALAPVPEPGVGMLLCVAVGVGIMRQRLRGPIPIPR